MKQWNLCIIINLLFYTAITQYMSLLLERQHFTAQMSPFWRFWQLCNENSADAAIASCAPSPRQGAINLCRASDIGRGTLVHIHIINLDIWAFFLFHPYYSFTSYTCYVWQCLRLPKCCIVCSTQCSWTVTLRKKNFYTQNQQIHFSVTIVRWYLIILKCFAGNFLS